MLWRPPLKGERVLIAVGSPLSSPFSSHLASQKKHSSVFTTTGCRRPLLSATVPHTRTCTCAHWWWPVSSSPGRHWRTYSITENHSVAPLKVSSGKCWVLTSGERVCRGFPVFGPSPSLQSLHPSWKGSGRDLNAGPRLSKAPRTGVRTDFFRLISFCQLPWEQLTKYINLVIFKVIQRKSLLFVFFFFLQMYCLK